MLKKLSLVVLVLVAIPCLADAEILYVDRATGDDSTTYAANGPSTPWATIGRAAWGSTNRSAPNAGEAAKAGDTVIVRAGTYTTVGTDSRFTPAYNPVNSGTAGASITFQAEGVVTLTYSSGTGPVIGAYQRNYITWRGFAVDEALCTPRVDTGPVVLWEAIGCVIEYCDIRGVGYPAGWGSGELHNGVRINAGRGNTIRHNYIRGFYGSSVGDINGAAILVDHSIGGLVENNEIVNSSAGFDIKRNYNELATWTVRYNYIHDCETGVQVDQKELTTASGYPVDVYQNLFVNITRRASGTGHYENRETYSIRFVNNTLVNCGQAWAGPTNAGSITTNAGHLFWNNIVVDCDYVIMAWDYASAFVPAAFSTEHNLYHNYTRFGWFGVDRTSEFKTFAEWRALGQDHVTPDSQEADPLFVNEVGGNYRLQAGSPARNAGVDRLDLNGNGSTTDLIPVGAYITGTEVIGRLALAELAAPRGVVIIR